MWTPYILPGMSFLIYLSQHSVPTQLSEELVLLICVQWKLQPRSVQGMLWVGPRLQKAFRAVQLKIQFGKPRAAARGKQTVFLEAGVSSVRQKNNRAEEMIILLLDANKTVNGVITGMFFQLPCDQQWQQIQSFQLAYYLGGAFPGWCPPGLWGSQERGCASLNTHRIKAAGCWEHGQWERWLNPKIWCWAPKYDLPRSTEANTFSTLTLTLLLVTVIKGWISVSPPDHWSAAPLCRTSTPSFAQWDSFQDLFFFFFFRTWF